MRFITGAMACTWVESTGQTIATMFSPSSLLSADDGRLIVVGRVFFDDVERTVVVDFFRGAR